MKLSRISLIFFDILITSAAFIFLYYLKFNSIIIEGSYFILFFLFILLWIILSLYYDKYILLNSSSFSHYFRSQLWSTSLTLFIVTTLVSVTELTDVSRLFLLQISIIPISIEFVLGWIIISLNSRNVSTPADIETTAKSFDSELKPRWVVFGGLTLFLVYFLLIRFKTGNFYLYPWSERILLILFASWISGIILTKKYGIIKTENIYYQITPYIKAGLVMFLIASIVFFFFRIEGLSRFLLFGTILATTIIEIISVITYYSIIKYENTELLDDSLLIKEPKWDIEVDTFQSDTVKYEFNKNINIKSIFDQISTLVDKNELVLFLNQHLNNIKISFYASSVFSTISIENLEILRNNSKNLIINLHELNDVRNINQFLITAHSKLNTDGIFVGTVLPIETTQNRLKSQMPRLLFSIYYPIHFIFTRILPKIPKFNKLYFLITKGKRQSISKAEIFGRLNYCGYSVLNNQIINEKLYFIAKKIKTQSIIKNPSYHPIVKLNRVGFNGEIIQIHKFRTMHPYSEFLQKDIYEENELDIKGKFKDDFRITSWGKLMRKFWIDELPQLYDWIQGRINFVGVRALSEHYFSLYPKEHQEFRIKFKPGIIPPFYVDMPESIDEIVDSERRYLLQKEKKPLVTDIRYGFKAIYNILIKGARSG